MEKQIKTFFKLSIQSLRFLIFFLNKNNKIKVNLKMHVIMNLYK